jgi:serine/threonine protein kinase
MSDEKSQRDMALSDRQEELVKNVQVMLGPNYGPIEIVDFGAQKLYGVSEWGPGRVKRGILIKRLDEPTTQRALRNRQRGYGLETEIRSLGKIPDAAEHHIAELIDYRVGGDGISFSVIDHKEGGKLCDRVLKEPLDRREIRWVFNDILDAVKHYTLHGEFHRDINGQNIIVTEIPKSPEQQQKPLQRNHPVVNFLLSYFFEKELAEKLGAKYVARIQRKERKAKISRLEATLCDFGIACDQGNVEPKADPTSGAHISMDPLVNMGKAYDFDSEIYAIADLLYFSATGKHIVEYDFDKGFGVAVDSGKSLLDWRKRPNPEEQDFAVKRTTKNLPRKLRKLVRRGMTLNIKEKTEDIEDPNANILDKYVVGPIKNVAGNIRRLVRNKPYRYESLDDFITDFQKALEPTILEKMASRWKSLTAVGAAVALGVGALTYGLAQKKDSLERAIDEFREDGKKITLSVDHNGRDLVVDNNIVDLQEPNIFIHGRGKDYVSYPKQNNIIEAKKGEELDIYVPLKEKPWKIGLREHGLSLPSFRGRVYLEGYEAKEFSTQAESFNEAYTRDFGGPSAGYLKYKIPADIKDGVHNLVIEIDPPLKNKSAQYKSVVDALKIPRPDEVINRKLIPIVVGNVAEQIRLYEAEISGYMNRIKFKHVQGTYENKMPTNLTYRASIEGRLDQEFTNKSYFASNMQDISVHFPDETNTETRALGIVARNDKGEPVYSVFVPVRSRDIMDREVDPKAKPTFWYELGIPKTNYWQEVKSQKEKMYRGN